MTLTPEVLAAVGALIATLCTGVPVVLTAIVTAYVTLRRSRADVRQAETQADAAQVAVRKDEMGMLRGELARLDAWNQKLEAKLAETDAENEKLRAEFKVAQDQIAAQGRLIDDLRVEAQATEGKLVDADQLIRFLLDRIRVLERALTDSQIAVPAMRRPSDARLQARLDQLYSVLPAPEARRGGPSGD